MKLTLHYAFQSPTEIKLGMSFPISKFKCTYAGILVWGWGLISSKIGSYKLFLTVKLFEHHKGNYLAVDNVDALFFIDALIFL